MTHLRPNRDRAVTLVAEMVTRAQCRAATASPPCSQVVRLAGLIDDETAAHLVRDIEAGSGTLHLEITSDGGCLEATQHILDALDRRGADALVSAHAAGHCSSAALLLFLRAGFRTADPGTEFVLHRAAVDFGQRTIGQLDALDLRNITDALEAWDAALLSVLDARLAHPLPADLRRSILGGGDVVLTVDQAQCIGLIHACCRPATSAMEQM